MIYNKSKQCLLTLLPLCLGMLPTCSQCFNALQCRATLECRALINSVKHGGICYIIMRHLHQQAVFYREGARTALP